MKTNKHKLKKGVLTTLLVSVGMTLHAQLPSEYLTKVSYEEEKTVTYSIANEDDLSCLSLRELSQYHGYWQQYTMDEYIDLDGDLITDKQFIAEEDVRDDWMEGYGRVLVGKYVAEVYAKDGSLIHSSPNEQDENKVLLTTAQAESYRYLNLDQKFYNQLISEYTSNSDFTVNHSNGLLVASAPEASVTFDNNLKIFSTSYFDSSGVKTGEVTIEYSTNEEEDTYYPAKETHIEWFLGDNGCCIRKVTEIRRIKFIRQVESKSHQMPLNRSDEDLAISRYQISTVAATNDILITSKKRKNEEVNVSIYDMAGRLLFNGKSRTEMPITLPRATRSGMYLIHITEKGNPIPVTGKVILNQTH